MTILSDERGSNHLTSPEEYFGFAMGSARKLARWHPILSYFRYLAESSNRLLYTEYGRDWGDRPLALLTISSPENLRNLEVSTDRAKSALRRANVPTQRTNISCGSRALHLPRHLLDPRKRSRPHPAHAGARPRTSHADRRPNLAHPRSSHFADRSIAQSEWTGNSRRLVRGNTGQSLRRIVTASTVSPIRGARQQSRLVHAQSARKPETVESVLSAWHPQIVFDLHQMQANGPRFVVPPYIDPYDPNVDPLIQVQTSAIGSAIAAELTAQGKPGVATSVIFEAFSPSRAYSHYHGGAEFSPKRPARGWPRR